MVQIILENREDILPVGHSFTSNSLISRINNFLSSIFYYQTLEKGWREGEAKLFICQF